MRRGDSFDAAERRLARLAAGQAALAIRAFAGRAADGEVDAEATLGLAGEALAAGADELRTAEEITRFATEATRSPGRASCGVAAPKGCSSSSPLSARSPQTRRCSRPWRPQSAALLGRQAVGVEQVAGLPGSATLSATLQLGQPSIGALQLLFSPRQRAERRRARDAGDVRRARRACSARELPCADGCARARANAGPPGRRRPGNQRVLALAHARDGSRPGRRAARSRPARRLPARRRQAVRRRGHRAGRTARATRRSAAGARARPLPLAGSARRPRRRLGPPPGRRRRRGCGNGNRGGDRRPAAGPGRRDRPARRLSRQGPRADGERVCTSVCTRCAVGGRRAERAAARTCEATR